MKKLLGVLLAFLMCCVPIGIQAKEEVLSFEYTGQKIEIEDAIVYYDIDERVYAYEAPIDCGEYNGWASPSNTVK